MSHEERYKQLALFSVIVAEVVVTPAACGALVYWAARGVPSRMGLTLLGAGAGLAIAFYRISLMIKRQKKNETEGK